MRNFVRSFELELKRMDSPECYFRTIAKDLQKKRDYIVKILNEVGLNPVIPEGGYFIMADWSSLGSHLDQSWRRESHQLSCFVFRSAQDRPEL